MKDQIQTLTSLISVMNVQSKPIAANDRQNTPDRNYNYPANGRQVTNDRNNFSGPCFKCQGRGHRQRECYWNGMEQSSSTAKCQLCQQEGIQRISAHSLIRETDRTRETGTVVGLKVAALVDSGSSINIMSKSLFDSVSDKQKLSFEQLDCFEIRLANNDTIKVTGTAKIKLYIETREEIDIDVYILPVTSHPFILGTDYLMKNDVVLDSRKCHVN
ncbi:unnamed protein product [Mytilus coruscus]|uniref:CCHC-type domain-containing protein n=1 Tax=Mytilus coruscus TaxID=42192 RepID=A0A6J8A092_MYTCO|nr:unnamed protein product [Mytilus coruscus]